MKKIFTKEMIIGLCVIVAGLILFFGIDYLKGINLFKPANFYYAYYDNVAGLEVAAPVSIDGYKVGQVRQIDFPYDKPGKIGVLLSLDKKLQIPSNSVAIIETGLLNGSTITIKLGDSSSKIPVGGSINTYEGGGLMDHLTQNLLPSVEGIVPKIDSLLYNLNVIVSDPALLQSVQRLDGISANLLATTNGLNATMTSQVPVIMRNASSVTYRLDTITAGLAQLSNELKQLQLAPTMANVEATTKNLVRFSEQLNSQNSSLGLLMNDPQLYNNLQRVTADVDSLILDLQRNPKRYISIKLL